MSRTDEILTGYFEDKNREIAELRAQLEAAHQWIPVSERLPDDKVSVIVSGGVAFIENGKWYTRMAQNCNGYPLPIVWEVTHWMPLPKIPNKSGGE